MSANDLDTEPPARADAPASDPWHFPDRAPVQIVSGELHPTERGPYADESNHNYMAMTSYADQDALVELVRHVSAANPGVQVDYTLPRPLTQSDRQSHLVILGNMAWCHLEWELDVPVRPVRHPELDGEVFETTDGQRLLPTLASDDTDSEVVNDVGFFWRAPSPVNPERTLTICSGIFTRGVLGAVRALTDRDVRGDNAAYLRKRFGDAATYGLLMAVRVLGQATVTPRLWDEKSRHMEFPFR